MGARVPGLVVVATFSLLLLLLLFLEQSLSTRPGKQLLHPLEAASGTALAGDVLSNDFRNAKRTSL